MRKYIPIILSCLLLFGMVASAQERPDYSGKYKYSVMNTPYGDFNGWLVLQKKGKTYKGYFINEENVEYNLKVIKVKGNQMLLRSNLEDTKSIISCVFKVDSIFADIAVRGDDFQYVMKGVKETQ